MVPLTLLSHTSCRGKYQGRKNAILDYYSRFILPLLFFFRQFIYPFGAKLFVRVRIRVTYPYIKKGDPLSLPESTTVHIETCIWCCNNNNNDNDNDNDNNNNNNKYLFLTEFEGCTISYGPSFFLLDLWPKRLESKTSPFEIVFKSLTRFNT